MLPKELCRDSVWVAKVKQVASHFWLDLVPWQVSVTKADQELGFAIQTCFVSPFSNPDRMSDYTIIENICPKDESVKFYSSKRVHFPIPHAEVDKKRFSFVFKSVFNTSLLFLQCELTLCTRRKGPQRLPKVSGLSSVWHPHGNVESKLLQAEVVVLSFWSLLVEATGSNVL